MGLYDYWRYLASERAYAHLIRQSAGPEVMSPLPASADLKEEGGPYPIEGEGSRVHRR